jgi:hypothetical protein
MNLGAFRAQVFLLYIAILIDAVINAVAGTVSHDLATQVAVLLYAALKHCFALTFWRSIQGLELFVSLIVCYLVLARTWYFEAGLFGLVVSKFRGVFVLVPLNFLLTMGMRGYYIVRCGVLFYSKPLCDCVADGGAEHADDRWRVAEPAHFRAGRRAEAPYVLCTLELIACSHRDVFFVCFCSVPHCAVSFGYYVLLLRLLRRIGQPRLYKPTPEEIDRCLRER